MISILIPIYNGIEYIEECVQSVIIQTYENWEIIIGVNGHPYNSDVYEIAKKYENEKIHVYDIGIHSCTNLNGKSIALNKMLAFCKYDYVAILDVDDIWMPNKLEIQTEFIPQYDVVGTQCEYFGETSGVPPIPFGDLTEINFTTGNPIINSSSVIRKKICKWDISLWGEDYELWLRLKDENKLFYNCNKILVKHRIHASSAFNSNARQHEDLEKILKKYRK